MFRCLHLYFLWDQEKPSLLISHRNRLFSYFFRNDCAFFIDAKCKCSGCNPIPGAGSSELCDYRPAFSSWKAELLLVSNCIFFLIISFIKGTKLTAQAIFTIAEKQSIRYTREKIKQGKNGFWLKKITTKLAVALGCFFFNTQFTQYKQQFFYKLAHSIWAQNEIRTSATTRHWCSQSLSLQ